MKYEYDASVRVEWPRDIVKALLTKGSSHQIQVS